MRVLILSGKFGMGHNSVARAITQEIYKIDSNSVVDTVDLVDYIYPSISGFVYKGFNKLVNNHPSIFNMFYNAAEYIELDMGMIGSKIARKIKFLLNVYNPDIIISTLPICAKTMSLYKKYKRLNIPLITCITDVSPHSEWVSLNTDLYLVPTQSVRKELVLKGVDESRIFVVGIPVKQEFKTVRSIRREYRKNVLIMGGGLGIIPELDEIMEALQDIENVQTTIITGYNRDAFLELQGKYKNTTIVGYVNNVVDYMQNADLMISKAGGITLFESIYCRTPMFVIRPFLNQEKVNAKFIEEYQIGKVIWDEDEKIKDSLVDLLNDLERIDFMKCNMNTILDNVIEDDLGDVLRGIKKEVDKYDKNYNYKYNFIV